MTDEICPRCGNLYSEARPVNQSLQITGPGQQGRLVVCSTSDSDWLYVHELGPGEELQSQISSYDESDHSNMGREEQVLYALREEDVGTWVTPSTICETGHVNDPNFRYSTVSSAMHRMSEEGTIRREVIDGQYFYSLPDDRDTECSSIEIGTDQCQLLMMVDHLGTAEQSKLADDEVQMAEQLRSLGLVDRRHDDSPDNVAYWLTDTGEEKIRELTEENDWIGGL